MKLPSRYLLALFGLLLSGGPAAGQSIWNTTNGNWNSAANWSPSGVPVSSPTLHLRFNATGAYTSTNNVGALTLNRLTVNNTSNATLTLAASATANSLTFDGVAPTLDITGTIRYTGLLGGAATITKTGTGTFIHDSNNSDFTGTIIINQGVFANWGGTSTVTLVNNFNPVSIVVNDGGTYQFGNAGIGDPNLPLTTYITVNSGGLVSWQEGQALGGFNLLGGTIDLIGGTATTSGTGAQSWTHGSITGNAYTAAVNNIAGTAPIIKTTEGTVTLSGAVAVTNTGGLTIKEGTVVMENAINLGTAPLSMGDSGTTGTLVYQGATATKNGNLLRIEGGAAVVNVSQATTVLTLSGTHGGMGMFTKTGPGTLTLSGAFTAGGATQVSGGTLRVNSGNLMSPFFVESGATLAVNVGSSNLSLTVPNLVLRDSTSTLLLELTRATIPGQALVTVENMNSFLFGEGATLRVTNGMPFASGIYTLLDYNGDAITGGLNLQLPGRTLGSLIYDDPNRQIKMEITGTDSVKWTGAVNSNWDVGTGAGIGGTNNWQLVTGGTATNFIDTDTVSFDDTATGYAVEIAGAVAPFSMAVDTNKEYVFSGTGKITGTTSLLKAGTGKLVLSTDNDYTGGTFVTGGTLQLGNGGTRGSFVGNLSLSTSTLAFDRSEPFLFDNTVTLTGNNVIMQNGAGTVTMNSRLAVGTNTLNFDGTGVLDMVGPITGTRVINKNGSGHLNLLGASAFNATLNINGGTVQLTDKGAGGDINAASIVINNSGTFIFGPDGNPDLPGSTIITVNSGGVLNMKTGESYGGFILNGGEYRATSSAGSVGSTGEAGTSVGKAVFDLRSGTITTEFSGNGSAVLTQSGGGVLAKTTSGTVTMTGGLTFSSGMTVQIREGTLAMTTNSVPTTGTVTNGTGTALAGLEFGTATTEGTLRIDGAGSATSSRNVTLAAGGGRVQVVEAGTALTFSGALTGTGPLIKTGAGALNLTGTLGSTGLLTAAEGTLRLKAGTVVAGLSASTGATLAVNNAGAATTLTAPSLNLANGSTLLIELNSTLVPTIPLVNITTSGGLTLAGNVILRVGNGQVFTNGTYTLVDYAGSAITTGFDLRLEGRTAATLVYNTASTLIQMNVTGTDTIKWTGSVNSTWDVGSEANIGGTKNWQLVNAGTATNFISKDVIRFDDTASNRAVEIVSAVSPLSMVVDTTAGYNFTGAGKITGTTALTKTGTGTLVLATDNDYSGGTVVTGGILQLGNGGTTGSITGALSLSGSILAFNRSDSIIFANAITTTGSNTIRQNGSATMRLNSALTIGVETLTFDGTGTLDLVGRITGTGIVNKNGSGQLNLLGGSGFTGTLNINGGTVQLTDRGSGGDLNAASIVINNGGTFIFGPDGNPDLPANTFITINTGGLYEIFTGESYGGFILNGGEYRASGGGSTGTATVAGEVIFDLRSGVISTTGIGGGIGQSGGGVLAKTTSGTVTIASGITITTATPVQIREGTLAMHASVLPATGSATAMLDFGTETTQGTLQIQGPDSVTTSRIVNIAAGGGRVDIVNAASTLTFTGAVNGAGSFTKSGAGTLNMTGAVNSTGSMFANGGVLRIKSGSVLGALSVGSGATLALAMDAAAPSLAVPTLTLAGGSTLKLELDAATILTTPLIDVTGVNGLTLTGSGDILLALSNSRAFTSGQYLLLDYAGNAITSGFALQVEGRLTASLVYNMANTQILADIQKGEDIRWTGSSSADWDVGSGVNVGGTQNWQTATSLAATNFIQADVVRFEDSASVFTVNLTTSLRPTSILVNSTADYTFSGSGKISGTGSLDKAGTGTLLITTDNDYTGTTTITGGQVQLGNGGTTGSIAGPATLNGGSLIFNRSDAITHPGAIAVTANSSAALDAPGAVRITGSSDVTLAGIISGAATRPLQMDGTGTLFLKNGNTFTGTTIINSGIVSVAGTTALGAATADVILNGGTLQLTASNIGAVNIDNRTINIGPLGGTLDFRVAQTFSGNGLTGTGNLVKTGAGRLQVSSSSSPLSGSLFINEGSLLLTGGVFSSLANLTIADGAQFIINDDVAGTWTLATGGKFTFSGNGGGEGALRLYNTNVDKQTEVFTSTLNREVVLTGAATLVSTEYALGTIAFTNNVTGTGALAKQGPGTLTLSGGANSYSGGTIINAGTLMVTNTLGSATGSGPVVIGTGAKLMGTGTISGNTTFQSGATVQAGVLATRGTLTLQGTTTFEAGSMADFRLTANGSNDRLVFDAVTLDTNATLRVLLGQGYTPVVGDTFDLIDWTSLGLTSDTNWVDNLDLSNALLSAGLQWNTSLFNSSGILSVAIIPEPSRALLIGLAFAGISLRRKRRH